MKQQTFSFSFTGRQTGAIGIFYKIAHSYLANDIHEALSMLYEDYEHISGLTASKSGKSIEIPKDINFVKVTTDKSKRK